MAESVPGENLAAALHRLNPEQRQAVQTIDGPLLIIAGAGSGKTGVVAARAAYMVAQDIRPSSILALTFTNKAADEMRERVRNLAGPSGGKVVTSTFHAFGLRVLREQSKAAGLRPNFTIYDSTDKLTALREAARELKLRHDPAEIKALSNLFSDIKTRRTVWNSTTQFHTSLYKEYTELLTLYNAVDFDDLILRPLELFETRPDIMEHYRQRYQRIMVDEFQDTSTIQYLLVRLLGLKHRNLCCVGDDDQSIYSWRGADFHNILNFEKDFPERVEIKLERNYRSTGIILNAANAIIANNSSRKDKNLWTEEGDSETMIRFALPENDLEEGDSIVDAIQTIRAGEGCPYHSFGILVRTNSQTRSLEEALLSANIPYSVSGGTSFFSRKEIKDVIGYLRVIDNPDDDVNFLRIINVPRRGIGKGTLEQIVTEARRKKQALYSASCGLIFDSTAKIASRQLSGLAEFVDFIEHQREIFTAADGKYPALADNLKEVISEIGYWQYLLQEFQNNDKIAKWRYENIQTFITMLERWEKHPDNLEPSLTRWLNRITLNARDQLEEEDKGKVSLMTIHASKGLEFDTVFLPGVEDGIIPHARSIEENPASMEEERRLFYVAITRARTRLFISSCQSRRIRGETITCSPSPFLDEIPQNLMTDEEMDDSANGEDISKYFANLPWRKES